MTARTIIDRAIDINEEVERFASFDHATRRFIAYAIQQVPELRPLVAEEPGIAGNPPLPFAVGAKEAAARAQAYRHLPQLRACNGRGMEGRRQRRLHFDLLLEVAWTDVRFRRLRSYPALYFCYERLVGPQWRELLRPCMLQAALARHRKSPPQPRLDRRLVDDRSVPDSLRDEPAPWFFPSLADADRVGDAPLLAML